MQRRGVQRAEQDGDELQRRAAQPLSARLPVGRRELPTSSLARPRHRGRTAAAAAAAAAAATAAAAAEAEADADAATDAATDAAEADADAADAAAAADAASLPRFQVGEQTQ